MKNNKMILLCIIIAILIVTNVFFVVNGQKPDYMIQIGKPQIDADHFVSAIDYTRSEPLKSKDDVDTVLFSLLSGSSVDAPPVVKSDPDAVLQIRNAGEYKVFYHVTLWLDGDTVIFAMGINDWTHYKKIEYAGDLIDLVEEQVKPYA